ncbi:hypothetical protein BRADI_5g14020v3 [Brachypodium distachyon]|uniref:DUF6598 domain-containing protein n=1 Tax=Brachypodium distachyon TaxID=15368 RepID=A0A2K2CH47_BRADI|nr:hypothetical protein BRADI_5g14020v3 [Brachypodium distachyon]
MAGRGGNTNPKLPNPEVQRPTTGEMEMFGASGREVQRPAAGEVMFWASGTVMNPNRKYADVLRRQCEILRRNTTYLEKITHRRRMREPLEDKERSSTPLRIAEKEGMADQESSQVSSIFDLLSLMPDQKEMDPRKFPRRNSNPAQIYLPCGARDDEKRLADCFDLMLHDMDDLANRMLSVESILSELSITNLEEEKVSVPQSLYTINELVDATSRVNMNAKEFVKCCGWVTKEEEEETEFRTEEEEDHLYTIKIVDIKGNLNWPLYVYGVIAAQDTVDHNRNLLFFRSSTKCQKLTWEDPFLRLTGPSRAIVALDRVYFEVALNLKDETSKSDDRALIWHSFCYDDSSYHAGLHTTLLPINLCSVELSLERLSRTVQATILSVQVVEGVSWPFKHGARVACSSSRKEFKTTPRQGTSKQVVLLDSLGEEGPVGAYGFLHLSGRVVSVELQDTLEVVVQAYSPSGHIDSHGHVNFTPQLCNISQNTCVLGHVNGHSKVEITVAWSCLVLDKMDLLIEGCVNGGQA